MKRSLLVLLLVLGCGDDDGSTDADGSVEPRDGATAEPTDGSTADPDGGP